MRRILLPLYLCAGITLHTLTSHAQVDLIAQLLEHDAEVSEQTAAIELFESLRREPLNVNAASFEELLRIPGLQPHQARAIIAYREVHGLYGSIEQVGDAAGIAEESIALISEFITLSVPAEYHFEIRHRVSRTIEKPIAYSNGYFTGSIPKGYTRVLALDSRGFSAGFVMEKDAGERAWSDHSAGFVGWRSPDGRADILLGNFTVEWGQGLAVSRNGYLRKSVDPIQPLIRRVQGIRGYVSSAEYEGFRGAAARLRRGNWAVSGFYSDTRRDARIDENGMVTSVDLTGYHRTETERIHENRLRERTFGVRADYSGSEIRGGITAYGVRYSKEFAPDDSNADLRSFSGDRVDLAAADFSWSSGGLHLFTEFALSDPGAHGFASGVIYSFGTTAAAVHLRDYAVDFYSPFGHSFADRADDLRNERGVFVGLKHRIRQRHTVSLYMDIFENPWRTATIPGRNGRTDIFTQFETRIGTGKSVTFNWRRKSRKEGVRYVDGFGIERPTLEPTLYDRYRVQADLGFGPARAVILRCEVRNSCPERSRKNALFGPFSGSGLLLSVRARLDLGKEWRIRPGCSWFSSGSERFYQYEPDLPGVLTIRQLSGEGERFHIAVSRPLLTGRLSVKYGITRYRDRESIGSGSTAIGGNIVQEAGLQYDLIR